MAANATQDDYVVSTFKLTANIEGIGDVTDIVAISATFALNTIPKASLVLACGERADKPGEIATAHKVLSKVKLRAKVKVYLDIETTDGKKSKSPQEKKLLIFEGFYAGFGFQRAKDNAQYTVHLVHWLDDLNRASMLSRNWFPAAPFSLSENASAWSAIKGAGGIVNGVPIIDPQRSIITKSNLERDLWERVLKKVLEEIMKWPQPGGECRGEPDDENGKELKEIINRMPGAAPKPSKIGLNLGAGISGVPVSRSIQMGLSQMGLAGYNYSTVWSMLIGVWGATFQFAVSPGVDFANLIPYFGALRWEEGDKIIEADEYGYSNFMCNTGTILEGIEIFWNSASSTGFVTGEHASFLTHSQTCKPMGSYPPKGQRDHRGTVLVKEPPNWLHNFVSYPIYAAETTMGPIGDIANPDKGASKPSGGPRRGELQKEMKDSGLMNRFAENWYKNELLQNRYGELSGKLRFDIAPGSTVKIKAPTRGMPNLPDNTDMVAMVAQVSYVINAELANAGTAFSLTHIRTIDEDADELKTSPKPPLYNDRWAGGPLAMVVP